MRERLLAYLLSDLDPAERAAVEAELAADPLLRQELEKLRECLDAGDGHCTPAEVPPPKLASRTCSFVDHAIHKSKNLCSHSLGAKALSESHDPPVRRQKWTLLDIGAAVCILVALASLLFPRTLVGRDEARLIACQNKMRGIGAALMNYSLQRNGSLPRIGPQDNAGVFVIALVDQGVISSEELLELLVCPSSELAERVNRGCVKMSIPTQQKYLAVTWAERERMRRYMAGDLAFSIGYQDAQGQIRQVPFSGSRFVPLLADAPSAAIAGFQSANHGGCGQNVLFQDLSVKYCKQCKCKAKRDHWYLNDDGQPAAGCHENDNVLAGSDTTPLMDFVSKK
jgi:hypothetical protein